MGVVTEGVDSDIHVLRGDWLTTVIVEGPIDRETVGTLREQVGGAIDGATERVVIDLAAATSIDAAGLGWLVGCHRQGSERAVDVSFRRPRAALLSRVRQTGLDRIVHLVEG